MAVGTSTAPQAAEKQVFQQPAKLHETTEDGAMPDTPTLVAAVIALFGVVFFLSGLAALRRGRLFRMTMRLSAAALLLALAGLLGAAAVATRGYNALTHEEVAATVRLEPAGPKRFTARFRFPDGREAGYRLAGRRLYVGAHILKWKTLAHLFRLHTP